MKLWMDISENPPPDNSYIEPFAVNGAKVLIRQNEQGVFKKGETIELIDIGYNAGEFAHNGGNYICLLQWLEKTGRNYPIRIHAKNPNEIAELRKIVQRNNWTEVI